MENEFESYLSLNSILLGWWVLEVFVVLTSRVEVSDSSEEKVEENDH